MTEAEWCNCDDPQPMLDFLRRTASERKLRLFGVACCRQLQEQLNIQALADALETAERYADTMKAKAALKRARQGVKSIRHGIPRDDNTRVVEWAALWLAEVVASENASAGVGSEVVRLTSLQLLDPSVQSSLAALMRCVFGNPLRPISFDFMSPAPAVLSLAQIIYDGRAFDRMPELAEALEKVGCTNRDVLDHCRGSTSHVRGCWAIDLLLGKE